MNCYFQTIIVSYHHSQNLVNKRRKGDDESKRMCTYILKQKIQDKLYLAFF